MINWVGTIVNQYSAVRVLINLAVWSIIRPFGFVLIRPSGFGRMDKFELLMSLLQECIEYYGAKRGLEICKDYYDDYLECSFKAKQVKQSHTTSVK